MGMVSNLNQAAVEALCSATYLEGYLECLENLPGELQRIISRLKELDIQTTEFMKEVRQLNDVHGNIQFGEIDEAKRRRALFQELGDEKMALVAQIIDQIENHSRQLDQDLENLDPNTALRERDTHEKSQSNKRINEERNVDKAAQNKRQRRGGAKEEVMTSPGLPGGISSVVNVQEDRPTTTAAAKKKKKRKGGVVRKEAKNDGDRSPTLDLPIDPDEPTYCLCDRVSFGEMIGCDNDACIIEWFHFECVNLVHKPKGRWFCPQCRGDKSNVKRTVRVT